MKSILVIAGLCIAFSAGAGDDIPRDAYEAGYALGQELAERAPNQARVDIDAVYRGVVDGLEAARTGTDNKKNLRGREGAYADDFAILNSQRPGVVTLPSGVQYEVLEPGDGPVPAAENSVVMHYEGSLSTGYIFDTTSNDEEPTTLKVADIVVPGFREALLLMPEGAHWRVVVPVSQGFARAGNNQLRRRDLIYDLQLLEVLP